MNKGVKHLFLSFMCVVLVATALSPNLVSASTTVKPQLVGGTSASMLLTPDGEVYTWGYGAKGELGHGTGSTNLTKLVPTKIATLSNVIKISKGSSQSYALKSDGTVWAWGYNTANQLGDGTITDSYVPKQVPGLTNVVDISNYHGHMVVVKGDGTVWTWGTNTYGQLGDSTTSGKGAPVQTKTITSAVGGAGSGSHSYAVDSDGTMWGWGRNLYGEIGDGSKTQKTSPVKVNNLTNIVSISASSDRAFAVDSSGSVWVIGGNTYGELGDGTKMRVETAFKKLDTISNVAKVSTYYNHTLFLKKDGTLWGAGTNGKGQITGDGNPSGTAITTPVQIMTDVVDASAGRDYSLALKSDGTLWGWGANLDGQLGDDTKLDRPTMVQLSSLVVGNMPTPEDPDTGGGDGGGDGGTGDGESGGGDSGSNKVDLGIEGGLLELRTSAINSFGQVMLSNQAKAYDTSFDEPIKVIDTRGTQEGWKLTVSATQFTEVTPSGGFKGGTSAFKLPKGTITLTAPNSVARVGTGTGSLPTIKLTGNSVIDDGVIEVASANAGSGMGEFNFNFPTDAITIVVDPTTVKVDRVNYPVGSTPYESTVTWELVSGP